MSYIHEGQGNWYLDLETSDSDLATATDPRIYYTKPNGVTAYWVATIVGTKLRKTFVDSDIDQVRKWKFQGTYVIATRTSKTKQVELTIYDALDNN